MGLAALAVLAAPHVILPACVWDRPGHNRFTGDVAAAVRHYADIPAPVAARLRQRIQARDFDDMAEIRRDSIAGRYRYAPDLRDMHFGSGQICRTVTRAGWAPGALERGMVYCEAGHCLIVPTVCGNLSRVTRLPSAPEGAANAGDGAGAAPVSGQPSVLVPDQALLPAAEPGPSFEQVMATPAGGLSTVSTPVADVEGPDDRYTTAWPDPRGRGSDGSGWPSAPGDAPGAAGLFNPPAPEVERPLPAPPAVPEPPMIWLWSLGAMALLALNLRRARRREGVGRA